MRALPSVLLAICLTGCPGQRRPPPRDEPPAPAPGTDASPVAVSDPTASVVVTPPKALGLAGLRANLKAIRAEPAPGDRAAWDARIERLDVVETGAFDLQETSEGAQLDAVYAFLEELAVVRDELVREQPR